MKSIISSKVSSGGAGSVGGKKTSRVVTATYVAVLLLSSITLSQQISDFNATFSYPCDNSYFDKGDGIFTFRKAGATPLRMRKITPDGWSKNKRLPVIIMFFGGGWTGDCAPEFKWLKNYFIGQGFVVLIAEYILGSPIEQKAIPDCKAAVRWVRENADSLGADPKKIISFGSSAGGHLAAAVGTVKGFELSGENTAVSSRPNLIISLWPVMDLTKSFTNMTSVDPKLVSPAWTQDDTTPPILIMVGANDPYINGDQQFNTNAASHTFEHQYKVFPNAGHDFGFRTAGATDKGNAGEDSTIAWSMAFIKQHNLLPGAVAAAPHVKKEIRAFPDMAGAGKRICYTLQGRFVGPLFAVEPSAQRTLLARNNGLGLLFTPDKGVVLIARPR